MNYQYRFGTSFTIATQKLYADGGFGRYYAGIGAALIQGEQCSLILLKVPTYVVYMLLSSV